MQRLLVAELTFVIVFLFINGGKSLNCFVCRSDSDCGCTGKVNISFSVACPPKPNVTKMYCRKIKQKLKFKDESSYTFIRECAYEKGIHDCYYYPWIELAFQETCECEMDLCNLGINIVPNNFILTVTFSLWVLIYLTKR